MTGVNRFDEVTKKLVKVATYKINNNKGLNVKSATPVAATKQIALDLGIEVQKDVNGIVESRTPMESFIKR